MRTMRELIHLVENARVTIKLTDLYDDDELRDETEALYNYVTEEDLIQDFTVKVMSPDEAKTYTTHRNDMTVYDAFVQFADRDQKILVRQKKQQYDTSRIIVVCNKTVVDGNHHLVAGILAKQPIRYIDLAEPDDTLSEQYVVEVTGVLRVSDRMHGNAIGCKSQCLVEINPKDFLGLTTTGPDQLDQIINDALPLHRYNQWSKIDDNPEYGQFLSNIRGEKQYGTTVMPFLQINLSFEDGRYTGSVCAHEGRHRAAALLKKGGKMVCAIALRPDATVNEQFPGVYDPTYSLTSEHIPAVLYGQYPGSKLAVTTTWKILKDDLLQKYRQ